MGYNTALMICNDGLEQLRRDPNAAEKIYQGVLAAGSRAENWVSIGNHCNLVSILPSQHADVSQVVLVGGNSIEAVHSLYGVIDWHETDEPFAEQVLRALAHDLGYNLTKTAWRKRRDAKAA
jgi:hypothetical protein